MRLLEINYNLMSHCLYQAAKRYSTKPPMRVTFQCFFR